MLFAVIAILSAQAPAPAVEAPADVPVATAAPASGAEAHAPSQFVKGELSMYLGADRLEVKNTRVGVSAGLDTFGQAWYLLVEPRLDLRFLEGKLGLGFGVPLRVELLDFANGPDGQPVLAQNLGKLRTADWQRPHDFSRLLKYVTYGRKEDSLYISAGQRYASSIGHGTIIRRYAPNLDANYPRASAQLDAYNDYAGVELFTNDVLEWNTIAALGFIKPLSWLGAQGSLARSFSVGVTAATDWKAPWQLQSDPGTNVRLLDADGRLVASTRGVQVVGLDAELKVLKTEHVDLKPYVDYSMLVGGDGGFTLGVLGRFNLGHDTVHAFRVVAELRALGSRYMPSYFDTFYEVDRFVFRELPRVDPNVARYGTKADVVLGQGLGQRLGYYVEGSWGVPGKVGVTLAVEGTSTAPEKNLVAHLELPVLDFLQVFGSFYKRGLTQASELAALDEKTVMYAGGRLKILPVLFLNARAYKTFRMNGALQRYDNQLGFVIDLEVGYEFTKKEAPPPKDAGPATPPAAPSPAEGAEGPSTRGT